MKVYVNCNDKRWKKYKIDFEKIANAAVLPAYKESEVSITLVDDDEIHALNREYRNMDKSTDVLSFPLGEDGVYDTNYDTGAKMLGDIVISIEHAVAQAEQYGHSLQREIGFLTVHSMLHLLGYDHEAGGIEQVRMREKEEQILTQLGVKRNSSYYLGE